MESSQQLQNTTAALFVDLNEDHKFDEARIIFKVEGVNHAGQQVLFLNIECKKYIIGKSPVATFIVAEVYPNSYSLYDLFTHSSGLNS